MDGSEEQNPKLSPGFDTSRENSTFWRAVFSASSPPKGEECLKYLEALSFPRDNSRVLAGKLAAALISERTVLQVACVRLEESF